MSKWQHLSCEKFVVLYFDDFFLCFLQAECARLKHTLATAKGEHEAKMAEFVREEKEIKEENLRLQRRLQLEMERREALCR